MEITPLTTVEEQLMLLMWKLDSFYLKDLMTAIPEPKPHQNTVSTYMKILVDKGYINANKVGRIYKYTVAVPFEIYQRHAVKCLIKKFFSGEVKGLHQFLVDENLIEPITEVPVKKIPRDKQEFPIADEILKSRKDKKKKKKSK